MTSKAERKRRKKRRQAFDAAGMGLKETPRREPSGRASRKDDTGADTVGIQARMKQYGYKGSRKEFMAINGPHMGTEIGMVLEATQNRRDVDAMWRTFAVWCAAEDIYRMRFLGQTEHCKIANLGMVPESTQTDQRHTVDLRSQEERDRDATSAWMRWQGLLGRLPAHLHTAAHDARLERKTLWRNGEPTSAGLTSLQAVIALHRSADA